VNDGTGFGAFTALAQIVLPGPDGSRFGTGTRASR
jgi:hypothetical protein